MKIKKPVRVRHRFTQTLSAPPERVFPLLCPVCEKEWVAGWNPDFVISGSGFAERDCIFVTTASPRNAIWVMTRHDRKEFAIEMYKVIPDHTVGRIDISLSRKGSDATSAEVAYEYTALSPEGESFLETFTEEWYHGFMTGWEKALNHYLLTGEKMP